MTTPAAPPQPASPPPQPPSGLDDAALAVAVAAIIAGGAATAATAIAGLKARHALTDAEFSVLRQVLDDITAHPPPVTGVIGPASGQAARINTARRVQYVLAAAKRMLGAARDASAQGKPVKAAVAAQFGTERRYYAQHQAAMWQRAAAAGRIDLEVAVHGRLLGWYAIRDKATTADCRKADGCNFYADAPPEIGLPGIGPHVNCRCFPGPPHPRGRLLPPAGFARAA